MKDRNSSTGLSTAAASAWFLFGVCSAGVSQAQKYTVTELSIPPGYVGASGASMNNAGVVVGNVYDSDGYTHAVEWTDGTPAVLVSDNLPGSSSESAAINNHGVVVGGTYDEEPGVFEIGPHVETANSFDHGIGVGAISDTNVIVGSEGGHPAIWDGVDLSQYPGFLPTNANDYGVGAQPAGVNTAGVIAGTEFDYLPDYSNTYPVAVRWLPDPVTHSPGATVSPLGSLGGLWSGANAINEKGWIVGWAWLGNALQHAALWEPTTGAFDLGTLGGKQSEANAVNAEGDIAGTAQNSLGVWHAALWTHKHFTATDLNLEISARLSKQFTLTSAQATNDRCMVLANGVDDKSGTQETFVLKLADQSQCNDP